VTDFTPQFEHLPNAPIREALVFMECYPPLDFKSEAFARFAAALETEYPARGAGFVTTSTVQLEPAPGGNLAKADTDLDTHLFWSSDEQRAIHLRRIGYAFTWLQPYPGWDAFQRRADDSWQLFRRFFAPERVLRMGLRFINHIDLPMPGDGTPLALGDYLTTLPNIAQGIGTDMESFFTRIVVPEKTIPARGIITHASRELPDAAAQHLPLTFDVEVYTTAVGSPEEVWEIAERLRGFKNRVFFSSFTERAMEMFR
jgi:uncharacterized protein (TIGR04255 family)